MTVEHSNTENTTALRIYYCGREQCAPGHFWGPAIRPHYLLHVVLHGKGEFFYQEQKYELSAGDAFLIEPMQNLSLQNFYAGSADFSETVSPSIPDPCCSKTFTDTKL